MADNKLNFLEIDTRGGTTTVRINDQEIYGGVSIEYPGDAKVFPRPVSITFAVHVYEERRMAPLFDLEGIDTGGRIVEAQYVDSSRRPTLADIFTEDVARILYPRVERWAKELDGEADFDDLVEALDRVYKRDGANICIRLEKMGWEVDTELVHILDGATRIRSALLRQAVEQWVRENNIKPAYKVGDRITLDGHEFAIISIDEAHATYSIVKGDRPSLAASIIPFESVGGAADDEEELIGA